MKIVFRARPVMAAYPDSQGMRYGYKASAEQFAPRELLDYSVLAERVGLQTIGISDHFQPWRHHGGHAPNVLPWLGAVGERTERAMLGTSVMSPILRYQPAIVAQAFATLACLQPDRIFLGVGTGEALNERPATGIEWPSGKERRRRLAEAIELMRKLWTEERVDFDGEYYRTEHATIYDRPEKPVPVYVAASGPLAAKLAGRVGDGLICTSGKKAELYEELSANVREGAEKAGRDPGAIDRMIEIKVSYDRDAQYAYDACAFWAALALTPQEKSGIDDPIEMERAADAAVHRAHTRFIVSADPEEVVERIAPYVELGFEHLLFHAPGEDQARFLHAFSDDVLPRLVERFGGELSVSQRAA
jgi:coenzyme F420-dependent glucose-6-phosphate dehydrogenase